MFNHFYGMPVYIDDSLGWESESKQVRFPRSKKRRIQKKWRKQSKNWSTRKWQVAKAYQMGNRFIMNSVAMAAIKKGIGHAS